MLKVQLTLVGSGKVGLMMSEEAESILSGALFDPIELLIFCITKLIRVNCVFVILAMYLHVLTHTTCFLEHWATTTEIELKKAGHVQEINAAKNVVHLN